MKQMWAFLRALGEVLSPPPVRARRKIRCIEEGTHHPVLIDLGRRKMCMRCGEW